MLCGAAWGERRRGAGARRGRRRVKASQPLVPLATLAACGALPWGDSGASANGGQSVAARTAIEATEGISVKICPTQRGKLKIEPLWGQDAAHWPESNNTRHGRAWRANEHVAA